MKSWLKFFLIVLATVVVYHDSLLAPFFQDDKILLNLPLAIIPNFPFRPVSQQIFYGLCQQIFGLNPLGYHFVLFAFFLGTLWIIYKLAKQILNDESKALVTTFFYALNISLFANFFWVATSYFTIGAFFFFLTLWLYLKNKFAAALITYILALGSNEMALVLPLIFVVLGWLGRFGGLGKRQLWVFLGTLPVILALRAAVGFPQAADYSLSLNFLPTMRWYVLRAFNLPEGVDRGGPIFYWLFFIFLITFLVSLWKNSNFRVLIFSAIFFFLGALPFFLMSAHMSSYYLTIALFGPALAFGETIRNRKLLMLAMGSYLLLTILGLEFLSQTHWIILKNTGPIGKF